MMVAGPGGGVIQDTTCEAMLVALVAARNSIKKRYNSAQGMSPYASQVLSKLVVYASDQAHNMVIKSSKVLHDTCFGQCHGVL